MQNNEPPNIFVSFYYHGESHCAFSYTPNKKKSIEIDPLAIAHWNIKNYLLDNFLVTNDTLPVVVHDVIIKYDNKEIANQKILKIEN